jgi:alpha-beta hydrolase superfamily lysophospholipase
MPKFQLSDPGSLRAQDPAMSEYLQAYSFPSASDARYGFLRMESPQKRNRVRLFGQAWLPAHAVGTVALLHGYSEHSGNFSRLVRDLVSNRFAVITLDFRGHGLSEGPASHVDSPHLYVEDAEALLSRIFGQLLPNYPLYLWAHSMGALVAIQLLLRGKLPVQPKAVALTSPLLGFPELSGFQKLLSRLSPTLARFVPTLPVSHGIPDSVLSHDEEYLARRERDPLIKRNTTPRWFESMKAAIAEAHSQAEKLQAGSPTLLMLSGTEKVTNLNEARRFAFKAYSGLRHKVIEFPGCYHELEKEPEVRARVLAETVAWYRRHT